MRKRRGLLLLLMLSLVLSFALSGCGGKEAKDEAKIHVQGVLDEIYKGQLNKEAVEGTDITEEDVKESFEMNIALEAEWFVEYFQLADLFDVGEVSEESMERIGDFYRKVYPQAKYEVQPSVEEDGKYYVDVYVYPMDIIEKFHEEDSDKLFDDFLARIEAGEFDDLSDEQLNDEFIKAMLEMLETRVDSIGYGPKETATFTMVENPEDGLYYIEDEFAADAYIIAY